MPKCAKCGAQIPDNAAVCPECKTPIEKEYRDLSHTPAYASPDYDVPPPKKSRWAPLGAWRAFGCLLLMHLPAIGLVFAIVWACGGAYRRGKTNLARAVLLCWFFGLLVLAGAAFALWYFGIFDEYITPFINHITNYFGYSFKLPF